ncbi:MAG TPA: TraR/DksA C4-type zinc finger protein [Gemmataceae bacterium]|nr:TraR/DksA C4-type zinc finger protein [Gemmataceae bacterium]
MTKNEVAEYRQQLLALHDRLTGDVSHLTDEALHQGSPDTGGNLSNVPLHMADLGTDNYERENTLHLLANEEHLLGEIKAAVERIDQGTFGLCEDCKGPILPKARLKELPYARYCVACAKKRGG